MNKNAILDSYIESLITNLNNTNVEYFKNLYTKEDFLNIFKDTMLLVKNNPNLDMESLRRILFEKSNITAMINDLIFNKKIAPGMVINFGTKYNREKIVCGLKQEVTYDENKVKMANEKVMTYDTIFDLASTSKLFTTISILKLCESGLININDEISYYLPEFQNIPGITIFDLITFGKPIKTNGRVDTQTNITDARNTLLTLYENKQPTFKDLYYPYTDMGAMTLKLIVEKITNMPFKDFVQEEIFNKANMNNSFLNVPKELQEKIANENYSTIVKADGSFMTNYDNVPGTTYDGKSMAVGHSQGYAPGHAGFFSTVDDMTKFSKALIDEKILSNEYLLKIGTTYTGKIMQNEDGKEVYSSHHGMLCFTKQLNSEFPYNVQHFLSGKAFLQPGYAGSSLCIDPLNEIYSFIGANRLHNRIHMLNDKCLTSIQTTKNGEKYFISQNGEVKTIATSYKYEIEKLSKVMLILTLQYQLLEKLLDNKQELTLSRTI